MKVEVETDDITDQISKVFDYEFSGTTEFEPPQISVIDKETHLKDFSIGLIVGPSGSGKSTILNKFGFEKLLEWDAHKAVASHFSSFDEAQEKFNAVGFNSIPSWLRPYHVLSNGEQFRVRLARQLDNNIIVDEFTSVVDRDVAKSCSNAIRRYVDSKGLKKIIFASCHYDIIEWLRPDWVFDTQTGKFSTRGYERPEIILEILPCKTEAWTLFRDHHYLSGDLNKSSRNWITTWNNRPVGFLSIIPLPAGTLKNAWRGHRTVVLPEFQGLGIGIRMSEALGEILINEGKRFFTKTAHPRLGEYRNKSSRWRPTSHNNKMRKDYLTSNEHYRTPVKMDVKYTIDHLKKHMNRICYAHEYIGKNVL